MSRIRNEHSVDEKSNDIRCQAASQRDKDEVDEKSNDIRSQAASKRDKDEVDEKGFFGILKRSPNFICKKN